MLTKLRPYLRAAIENTLEIELSSDQLDKIVSEFQALAAEELKGLKFLGRFFKGG